MINETVFYKFAYQDHNLIGLRETEFQMQALQVMIIENYLMGQKDINYVAIGVLPVGINSVLK